MIERLVQIAQGLSSRGRNLWYRLLGMRLEGYVWMRAIHAPRQWSQVQLGKDVALDHGVQILASGDGPEVTLKIGAKTYVNRFTTLDAHSDLKIGEGCMIGPYCYLTDADHEKAEGLPVRDQEMKASFLHIEDDVWVGSHVVILPGVTVGAGAVIGAGSVVTHDIPPNAIAFGTPARVQSYRTP